MTGKRVSIAFFIIAALFGGCASPSFTVEMEPSGTKILKGYFERKDLEHDTLFTWYKPNYDSYVLDSASLSALGPQTKDLHFLLVLGTWCGDSKHEVPKVMKIFDALGISEGKFALLGVDRLKKSPGGTSDKYNVNRVPTLIVFRGDQELGRIVEYPKESLEKDLLKLLRQ